MSRKSGELLETLSEIEDQKTGRAVPIEKGLFIGRDGVSLQAF